MASIAQAAPVRQRKRTPKKPAAPVSSTTATLSCVLRRLALAQDELAQSAELMRYYALHDGRPRLAAAIALDLRKLTSDTHDIAEACSLWLDLERYALLRAESEAA